jgi:formamidopyrimidine-DNA glycosylase
MPEIPDVVVYCEQLARRLVGEPLQQVRVRTPFVLRSFDPPIRAASGKRVLGVRRLGKRIVMALEDDLFLVVHLMVAGRFKWKEGKPGVGIPGKVGIAAFDFPHGTLLLTEASMKKRASIHLVKGEASLAAHHAGGLEVQGASLADFRAALVRENHTLKRTLTDPRIFSGIGNAYSDEILHAAHLSPVKLSQRLDDAETKRLYESTQQQLDLWTDRLRAEAGDGFLEKVTAFRPDMAVHGKYGQPCPVCGSKVQRIRHAENETNYCPTCQTEGKLLADRALSRLLKSDWPKSLDELEEMKAERKEGSPR